MRKIIMIGITLLFSLTALAQEQTELNISFEGVSFALSGDEFIRHLSSKLGWEVVEKMDAGAILSGKYCGAICIVAVELSPKNKLPVRIRINGVSGSERQVSPYSQVTLRLIELYGTYKSVDNDPYIRVWQPKFREFETVDAYAGVIVLEKTDKGFELGIIDNTNRMISEELE